MIAKRILRTGIRILLLGLMFAQAAIASNACLTPSSMRAQPAANAVASHCDQSDEINLNRYLYQTADQTCRSATPPAFAAADNAILTVTDATCLPARPSPIAAGNAGHDPPIPIRFCSFLI